MRTKRFLLTAISIVAALLLGSGAVTASASPGTAAIPAPTNRIAAAVPEPGVYYRLIAKHSLKCLEASTDRWIRQISCTTNTTEFWRFEQDGWSGSYPTYKIYNQGTGDCLLRLHGIGYDAAIQTTRNYCDGNGIDISWVLRAAGSGTFWIESVFTGDCITVPDANRDDGVIVEGQGCDPGDHRSFIFW